MKKSKYVPEEGLLDWEKYSTWSQFRKLARVMIKGVRCWLAKVRKTKPEVTLADLTPAAEKFLIRELQIKAFFEEREELIRYSELNKSSALLPLRAFIDDDKLLRVGSRTALSEVLPYDQKHPVILPKKERAVELLLTHVHEQVLRHNGGHGMLLAELLTKYWLIDAKAQSRKVTQNCVRCKRLRNQPIVQIQGLLPKYRLPGEKVAPFQNVIIDLAGPFSITVKRSTVKRYIVVFSCMTYRAIHLEIVSDISQDTFLMAFDRFTARRGVPSICRTDNGTNFRAASKELIEIWKGWDQNKLLDHNYGDVQWLFSAPLAPNTQGAVERMVQHVKKALYLAMAHRSWKEEVFETVVVRSEGIINNRPLTYISTNPKDPRPITPNSFLMPMTNREQNPIFEIDGEHLKKRWKEAHETLDKLWRLFIREIIPTLHRNTVKGGDQVQRDLREGDVVALLEEQSKGLWPLARVTRVLPDDFGNVRFADVVLLKVEETKKPEELYGIKLRNRHISKLMLLLPESSSPTSEDRNTKEGVTDVPKA